MAPCSLRGKAPLGMLLLSAALLIAAVSAEPAAAAMSAPRFQDNPCAGAPRSSIVASSKTCQDFIFCCDGEAYPNFWSVPLSFGLQTFSCGLQSTCQL